MVVVQVVVLLLQEMKVMKVNYDLELLKFIDELDYTPRLLLHSCCGPCSSYVISFLSDYFDITVVL